jgi:beta-glucosidase
LFTSVENTLDANWHDKAPRQDMDDDNFGVRWSGEIQPRETGGYRIGVITTCNTKVMLQGKLIAYTEYHYRNEYGDPRLRISEPLHLEKGQRYSIVVEAGESYGDAQVQLVWATPDEPDRARDVAQRADAIVLCMGLTARMEGEEMKIDIDGFKGGDRTRLDLPDAQQRLIKRVSALGKPVVLVLLNGSALALPWEKLHIPAIIEAWYPGQAAGRAIADVLFGDYNPGGRLPVTFYSSAEDLPPFEDYAMSTRTYRYFSGKPLYSFGYGLSYTAFGYTNLSTGSQYHDVGDTVKVAVDVSNTGPMAGDEVVQLYISHLDAPVPVPLRSLCGFRRVHLLPGESTRVEFSIAPDAFSIIDAENHQRIVPGDFEVSVGGGQPGAEGATTIRGRIQLK